MFLFNKWFLLLGLLFHTPETTPQHPFYVSVTEIRQNNTSGKLEIMCKIFTDDFEHTLRIHNKNSRIDLLKTERYQDMLPLVDTYITRHLSLTVNGKPLSIHLLGFEQEEEGIISYFESDPSEPVQTLKVQCNLLYEYQQQQHNIFHVYINDVRKSYKLSNPDEVVTLTFKQK